MGNVLVFDFDGVIADSLEILMKNFINACQKNNVNQIGSKEKFLKLFEKNFYGSLVDLGVNKEKIPKILGDLNTNLLNEQNKPKLFYGVENMLKRLSKNNKIIIVTSNVTQPIEDFL